MYPLRPPFFQLHTVDRLPMDYDADISQLTRERHCLVRRFAEHFLLMKIEL